METAIAALIVLTIVLFGVLTLTYAYISSQDTILESWREMEERLGDRARTNLSPVSASTNLLGTQVYVTLSNEGNTKLADFGQWDVIAQYDTDEDGDYDAVQWFTYYDGVPMNGEWTTAIGEVFEPDIFNPGEVMTITIMVSSEISSTGVAIIATPNGISASKDFTR
jgi:archaellum component FlaF (FlaF/FlaG flagellin family)